MPQASCKTSSLKRRHHIKINSKFSLYKAVTQQSQVFNFPVSEITVKERTHQNMNETIAKLFEERRMKHGRVTGIRPTTNGSASDPICLDDDESRAEKTETTNAQGHSREESRAGRANGQVVSSEKKVSPAMTTGAKRPSNPYKTGKRSAGSAKRARSFEKEGPEEFDRKMSAKRVNDKSSNGQTGRRRSRAQADQVPMKLLTTRLDEENHRACGEGSSSFRSTHATLRQLLGFDNATEPRQMRWVVACNYLVDFDYFMNLVPELMSCPLTIFFYGSAHSSPEPWKRACTQHDGTSTAHFVRLDPGEPPQSAANPLRYKIAYGVHHTKMFLIGYPDGIRVIIYTANLCPGDTHYKAQGAYVQDFPLKQDRSMEACQFEKDLVSYMETYGYRTGHRWDGKTFTSLTRALRRFDFSSAKVVLIPSTPGYHNINKAAVGLLKLRRTIREHASSSGSSHPVVCQFSSMGSLSAKWLNEQFLPATSLVDAKTAAAKPLADQLKLVYPTVEEIRTSVEGYRGGGSVPGGKKNVEKPFLQPLLCKWSSTESNNPFKKDRNVPHIKSYYQLGDENASMNWFLLSSHNMSTAAFGQEQNGRYGRTFFVRHWELGVLFSPQLLGAGPKGRLVPFGINDDSESAMHVPLPYALVPEPYGHDDKPWDWEATYPVPDAFGCFSVSDPGQMGGECIIQ